MFRVKLLDADGLCIGRYVMVRILDLDVDGVYISRCKTIFGNFRLRCFQEKILEYMNKYLEVVEGGVVGLTAPTGAGKSLTLLLGYKLFMERGMRGFGCIGLYPTNELLEDQYRSIGLLIEKSLGFRESAPGGWIGRIAKVYSGERDRIVLAKISGRILKELEDLDVFKGLSHLDILARISMEIDRLDPSYSVILATPDLFYYLALGIYGSPEMMAQYIQDIIEGREPRIRGLKDRLSRMGSVRFRLGSKPIVFFDEYHTWSLLDYLSSIALIKIFTDAGLLVVLSSATPLDDLEKHLKEYGIHVYGRVVEEGSGSGDIVRLPSKMIFYGYSRDDALKYGRGGLLNIYTVQKLTPIHVSMYGGGLFEYTRMADAQSLIVLDRISYTLETVEVVREKFGDLKIAVATGLIREGDLLGADVVVGNRAIELGIDNPRAIGGIVSAKTYSSLIQRIGRIGRREYGGLDKSMIHIMFTSSRLSLLEEELGGSTRISYHRLTTILKRIMPSEPSYTFIAETELGRAYTNLLIHLHRFMEGIVKSGGVPAKIPKPPQIDKRLKNILGRFGDRVYEVLSLRTSGIDVKYRFVDERGTKTYDLFTLLRNFEVRDAGVEDGEIILILDKNPVSNPHPLTSLLNEKYYYKRRYIDNGLFEHISERYLYYKRKLFYNPRTLEGMRKTLIGGVESRLVEALNQQPATIIIRPRKHRKTYELLTYTSTTIPVRKRGETIAYILLNKNSLLPYILEQSPN